MEGEKKIIILYFLQCRVNICYLIFLFFCYLFRKSICYLFLLEESDCSRLGTLPFSLVFDFRVGAISAGSGIAVLLCGLKYFTCLSSAGVTLY